jgi:hypothetical protein
VIGFRTLAGAFAFLALGMQSLRVIERWWLTRHLAAASRQAWRLCRSASAGTRVGARSFTIHLITVIVARGTAMAAHVSVEFSQVLFPVLPAILIATDMKKMAPQITQCISVCC